MPEQGSPNGDPSLLLKAMVAVRAPGLGSQAMVLNPEASLPLKAGVPRRGAQDDLKNSKGPARGLCAEAVSKRAAVLPVANKARISDRRSVGAICPTRVSAGETARTCQALRAILKPSIRNSGAPSNMARQGRARLRRCW